MLKTRLIENETGMGESTGMRGSLALRNGSNTPLPHKDPGRTQPHHTYLISRAGKQRGARVPGILQCLHMGTTLSSSR